MFYLCWETPTRHDLIDSEDFIHLLIRTGLFVSRYIINSYSLEFMALESLGTRGPGLVMTVEEFIIVFILL